MKENKISGTLMLGFGVTGTLATVHTQKKKYSQEDTCIYMLPSGELELRLCS